MFKKTITYKDFNDVDHTEDVYFNILAPELADLEFNPTFQEEGGMSDYIRIAMSTGEGLKIYTLFKLLIVNSYGRRSADGARFNKKPEWTEEFMATRSYEEFFMWLVENPKNAEDFYENIVPSQLSARIKEIEVQQAAAGIAPKKSVTEMSHAELQAAYLAKIGGAQAVL